MTTKTTKLGHIVISCIIIVALNISAAIAHHEKPVMVEAEGQITLGDDSTISQAKAAALNNARRTALEKTTGVEVRGSSAVYNYQLINDLVITATKGMIVQEKVIGNSCKFKDEYLYCIAKIQAFVARLHDVRRGEFAVAKLAVHRPDRQEDVKSSVFQGFDELHIHATANQDAYINIFSVDQNGNIAKL